MKVLNFRRPNALKRGIENIRPLIRRVIELIIPTCNTCWDGDDMIDKFTVNKTRRFGGVQNKKRTVPWVINNIIQIQTPMGWNSAN